VTSPTGSRFPSLEVPGRYGALIGEGLGLRDGWPASRSGLNGIFALSKRLYKPQRAALCTSLSPPVAYASCRIRMQPNSREHPFPMSGEKGKSQAARRRSFGDPGLRPLGPVPG
jgi:hypothetical protein